MDADRIQRLARGAGLALGALAAIFVAIALARESGRLLDVAADAELSWLALGVLVFIGAEIVYASRWPATLRLLGFPVDGTRASASFLVTQAAKFVPGSVWHAVGRVSAARQFDVPRRAAAAGLMLEAGASVFAALWLGVALGAASRVVPASAPVGPVVISIAIAAAGVAALVGGWWMARRWFVATPGTGSLTTVASWHLLAWIGYALAAACVGAAFGVDGLVVAGAFTLAWAAGFVVPGVPAGLGIREVVMTAALGTAISTSRALAVVVATRAVWTLVQLGLAGLAVGLVSRRRLQSRMARTADR